ncbi:MAG: type I DNA topoisomerase, partial [Candidatus Magasanikbacteria bacterium]|nr:type I DNA topoisomerase [Candidatus Magasanikbacteria bacterium]
MKTLVIVESPTKAKTITKFLGKDYKILSSFGHIRDLPKSKIGVDVEHGFEPTYVVSKDKAKTVKELKDAAKKCGHILFATDADREGEAISFHLAAILDVAPEKAERIVFHEITKSAILEAIKNPRPLDMKMVDAQQARRVLDRLVGYNLSPFLWRKVAKGLSAGRVQSVAVRLVVEREREIQAFKAEEYWSIEGLFICHSERSEESSSSSNKKPTRSFAPTQDDNDGRIGQTFVAKLNSVAGKKVDKMDLKNKEQVDGIVKNLAGATYKITAVEEKQTKRQPPAPFTTSSLQQEANHQLGFSAKQTMRLAQQLYEGVALGSEGQIGLITYMRTDSVNLADKFLAEATEVIGKEFGNKYQIAEPRKFKNKNKSAQEAHEAVRPTEVIRTPASIEAHLDHNQFRLYDLIWKRAVATQMAAAELNSSTIDLESVSPPARGGVGLAAGGGGSATYGFHATGQIMVFDGFLKLYPEKAKENALPKLVVDEPVICKELKPEQHFTEPPARYSDATLVKVLEEYGIGRPSTYAPTIATIEDRGYVERNEAKKLQPKEIAYLVNDLLVEHFPQVVDYKFTAQMEENLDEIARGEKNWQPIIATFYHPFKENLDKKDAELNKKDLTEEKTDEVCAKCGKPMVIKMGRFGKFLACTGYPECKTTKPMPGDEKAAPMAEPTDEKCEKCGEPMLKKMGRYGPFLGCSGYPKCKNLKGIEIKMHLTCSNCAIGDIVQRRSK